MFDWIKKSPRQMFWIVVVILASIVFTFLAISIKSEAEKSDFEETGKLVRVMHAEKGNGTLTISAYGVVQPDIEVSMKAEVSGRVLERSPHLTVGGIVQEGEVLVRIDPRDFQNLVEQEKAAYQNAELELQVERGRQIVSEREWGQLSGSIKTTDLSEELALRKPQLREKEAALSAAESRLEKARIDLGRTVIKSPLDAVVISQNVEVGDYLTPQTEFARLVSIQMFRVQASVPLEALKWLKVPTRNNADGSAVKVIQKIGGSHIEREGRILRLLGDLDPNGRMARLLVGVEDPLGLQEQSQFPLLLGSYVSVEFEGPVLDDHFVLPRGALHDENKVWIKNADGRLEIRDVNVVQKKADVVYIDQGLRADDAIVISPIGIPIEGMKLETVEDVPKTDE
jgi:RND family efflux transporter MFP subunit